MLRSVKGLENFRVLLAGRLCGRIKDVYLDDNSWKVRFLKVSLDPIRFEHKQILLTPSQIAGFGEDSCDLRVDESELAECPLDSSFLPVCLQYALLRSGSPQNRPSGRKLSDSDPHLRSARALMTYGIYTSGEFAGILNDFVLDDSWQIRYIQVEQQEHRKRIHYQILPSSIRAISWSTERVVLSELNPVTIEPRPSIPQEFTAAA